jgi:CheY-like chemotaxis protein
MTVLIVDDNKEVRRLIRDYLPPSVEQVFECDDGDAAFALYERYRPDWVLMDQDMPRIDGITAIREIITKYPTANICMVTAFNDDDLRDEAFAAGAGAFVVKDNLQEIETILVS